MDRKTKQLTRHHFTFDDSEMADLRLESEQWEYMNKTARDSLKKDGYQWVGGETDFEIGYLNRPSTFTIFI